MAIIAPRRNEPVIGRGGFPTIRFAEYLEASTKSINTTDNTGAEQADIDAINLTLKDNELLHYWFR